MSTTVDARGLSCPQPVMLTHQEIETGTDPEVIVLVDTETSKENVTRAAKSHGCTISDVSQDGDGYRIMIQKEK